MLFFAFYIYLHITQLCFARHRHPCIKIQIDWPNVTKDLVEINKNLHKKHILLLHSFASWTIALWGFLIPNLCTGSGPTLFTILLLRHISTKVDWSTLRSSNYLQNLTKVYRLSQSVGSCVRFNWLHLAGESWQFIHTVTVKALKMPIDQWEAQKLISHITIVQCERLTLPLGDVWALKLYYTLVPLKSNVASKNPWMGDYMQKKELDGGFNLVYVATVFIGGNSN